MAGSRCCDNPPTLSSDYGAGSVTEIGGLKAYVTGSSYSSQAILLISDVFGYEAPILRNIADKVAASGFYTVVPDFFRGDPYTSDQSFSDWTKSHGTDKGYEDVKPIVAALKSKGISAIGAAGFCWGGKVAVELSKSNHIQAAVLLHPGLVTVDDIKEVKVPIAILGGENDEVCPPALLKQLEQVLSTKPEIHAYVKIFPGVGHGWTLRYNTEDEKAIKYAEEAHKDMLDWFTKYAKRNAGFLCQL